MPLLCLVRLPSGVTSMATSYLLSLSQASSTPLEHTGNNTAKITSPAIFVIIRTWTSEGFLASRGFTDFAGSGEYVIVNK